MTQYFDPTPIRPTVIRRTPTDLRTTVPDTLIDGSPAFIWSPPARYYYSTSSGVADDGVTVIKPNAILPANPGRWLLLNEASFNTPQPSFSIDGAEYSAAVPGGFLGNPLYIHTACTISAVAVFRRYAGSAGSSAISLLKNGVPIVSGLGVGFGDGDYAFNSVASFAPPGSNVLTPGDYLEATLDSAEAYNAGPPEGPEGLSVYVLF